MQQYGGLMVQHVSLKPMAFAFKKFMKVASSFSANLLKVSLFRLLLQLVSQFEVNARIRLDED